MEKLRIEHGNEFRIVGKVVAVYQPREEKV